MIYGLVRPPKSSALSAVSIRHILAKSKIVVILDDFREEESYLGAHLKYWTKGLI